jgi:hypothetical protein
MLAIMFIVVGTFVLALVISNLLNVFATHRTELEEPIRGDIPEGHGHYVITPGESETPA